MNPLMCTALATLALSCMVGRVHGDYANYTDVSSYNRYRRSFDSSNPLTFGISMSLDVPLVDLGTDLSLSVPFSFDFPSATTTGRAGTGYGDYYTGNAVGYGRSLDSSISQRKGLFNTIEHYLGRFGGVDGRSCLKRAICEVAATPAHQDGILGDAMNLLLKVDTEPEAFNQTPEYADAQQVGETEKECTRFHADCPVSIFKIIDTFQFV